MKWITKDYKGNKQVWYSGDVLDRIREFATAEIIGKKYGAISNPSSCEEIINFLNEIDEVKDANN